MLQIWYADESAFAGYLANIKDWFDELCVIGLPLRYFPEPDRSIFITDNKNHSHSCSTNSFTEV